MRIDGILLIFIIISALSLCGAATAHPGHGTPIEEPSDPGTGTGTDPGSSGTTSSGSSQSSSSSGSTSTSSRSSDSTAGVTQSDETGTVDTQTTDTTTAQTGNSPEKTYETSGSSNSAGGPVAMIGLMVVIGLIAMSFPYNEGGTLRSIQLSFFSR